MEAFWQNFENRDDLKKYGDNALLLYALQIKFALEDIDEVASNSLVDGPNDKKIDLLYIDPELELAVIAQSYFSRVERQEAPVNKASDLNTGISWLLSRHINELPERIRSGAMELRESITSNSIKEILIWYVHNLPESTNVKNELKTVENTLYSILQTHFNSKRIAIRAIEVGIDTIESWYQDLTIPIQINDELKLENIKGFELNESKWESFTASIMGSFFYDLYQRYNTKLFSANIRDYLGSRKADSNINNGIKSSAQDTPNDFYVFNNGVTAVVNSFEYKNGTLLIKGISVVNGAQTCGSIGSLKRRPSDQLKILTKFIKPKNHEILPLVVKYNNSQNKIMAPDFRSNDKVQRKLINEFKKIPGIDYSARRGGAVDIIKRNPNTLPSVTAGQILAAFHKDPDIAYNQKSKIWESDKLYSTFFNEHTTAKHIFFIYSLLKAIEDDKQYLINNIEELKETEQKYISFLRTRGAIIFFITAIAQVMEDILNKKIPNKFFLKFCDDIDISKAISLWKPILGIVSAFSPSLQEGLSDGIKNKQKLEEAIGKFKQLVGAVRNANQEQFENFAKNVCCN